MPERDDTASPTSRPPLFDEVYAPPRLPDTADGLLGRVRLSEHWDAGWQIGSGGDVLVTVIPMLFNDRVIVGSARNPDVVRPLLVLPEGWRGGARGAGVGPGDGG